MVTNGSLEAGMMLFDHLVEPGDTGGRRGAVLRPHAAGARERGAELLAVPLEDDGIDVGALEAELERGAAARRSSHIIPNFHNPAGCTLSLEKRERLLELAAEYDFLIFEDDPYRERALRGRGPADDAVARQRRTASSTRARSRRRSRPACASAT